jgi:hypothetical protein
VLLELGGHALGHAALVGVPERAVHRVGKRVPQSLSGDVAPLRDGVDRAAVDVSDAPVGRQHHHAVARALEGGAQPRLARLERGARGALGLEQTRALERLGAQACQRREERDLVGGQRASRSKSKLMKPMAAAASAGTSGNVALARRGVASSSGRISG